VNVLLLVLDGLPARHVGPDHTPVLAGLAAGGGWVPAGGVSVMTSATYPNHATFVTGVRPERHGLLANRVEVGGRVVAAEEVGPAVPTLFDACRDAGKTALAVFGDQHLVGVTGARAAARHWPPDGVVGAGVPTDPFGYPADNATVVELVGAVAARPDLVIAQLNGPDTAGHLWGPDSPEALDAYSLTDGVLGAVQEALAAAWDQWVVLIVSDHDQETVSDPAQVDLRPAAAAAGLAVTVVPEGSGAVVAGVDPLEGAWLDGVAGVAGHEAVTDTLRVVWAEPGRLFGSARWRSPLRGAHGGIWTRSQVSIVCGGHPAVGEVAAGLAAIARAATDGRGPAAEAWAPTVAALLGVDLPAATGTSLLS
jgi:hypothetical protein